MNAPVDQKSSPPEASPIQPLAAALGQLPGEFAIRTYLKTPSSERGTVDGKASMPSLRCNRGGTAWI
jgi:hypothetical protein